MIRITETVKQLLIVNIIFFVASMFVGRAALHYLGLYFPESELFRPWQIITHMFMHANLSHILFNMLGLYMFGSVLEEQWGAKKFLFFYISCGLGAALLHIGINYYSYWQGMELLQLNGVATEEIVYWRDMQGTYNPAWGEFMSATKIDNFMRAFAPVIGASGALYGIMVAFGFMYAESEMRMLFFPIPIKAKYFIPSIIVLDLFLALRGRGLFGSPYDDGVAHVAHLGGALVGFIMMWYWKKNQFNKNRWD